MENKNKFTPGPWSVHGNIGKRREIGIVADSAPCIISIMGNQKEWPVEARANAVLIAAAPDMLEALKSVVPYLYKMKADGIQTAIPVNNMIMFAEAVIKKALGE